MPPGSSCRPGFQIDRKQDMTESAARPVNRAPWRHSARLFWVIHANTLRSSLRADLALWTRWDLRPISEK
jgi:hypothetical protein